jgi:mannitol/fructose-specific phosphotransferase system IIA component (Ntr-type)
MRLLDYTTEAAMLPVLVDRDLGTVVKRLASAMSAAGLASDPAVLARDVMRREAAGGTALPSGLVIPHATSEAARGVHLAVATLERSVVARDDAGGDQLVDVVVLLTAPPGESRVMLRVLARLAREIRGGLLERLRRATSAGGMVELFAGSDHGGP